MDVARNALLAIVVGVVFIGLAAGVTAYQEPRECSTSVNPAAEDGSLDYSTVLQYSELSSQGKAVFDRARTEDGSVTVTGDACPADFDYTAGQSRYVVEKGGEQYAVRTYKNDLVPQVGVAVASLILLALTITGVGIAGRTRSDTRLPLIAAGTGVVVGGVTTASVTAGSLVWHAAGLSLVAAAGLLVGAGLTYRARYALGVAVAAVLTGPVAAVVGVKTIAAFVIGVTSVAAPVLVGIGVAIQYFR
jgi:hypothetical protein